MGNSVRLGLFVVSILALVEAVYRPGGADGGSRYLLVRIDDGRTPLIPVSRVVGKAVKHRRPVASANKLRRALNKGKVSPESDELEETVTEIREKRPIKKRRREESDESAEETSRKDVRRVQKKRRAFRWIGFNPRPLVDMDMKNMNYGNGGGYYEGGDAYGPYDY